MKKFLHVVPFTKLADNLLDRPVPANTLIPDWYKNTPKFLKNEGSQHGIALSNNIATNTTMKSCSPFLDALTSGYIATLPLDIEFRVINDKLSIKWRHDNDFVTEHSENQYPNIPSAFNGQKDVLKWSFEFVLSTPPGYSVLFTHPLNRHDLPFRTFSGVVDTDKYTLPVQFPFQILNLTEEITVIERGTPVCQFIPFKREDWKLINDQFNEEKVKKDLFDFKSKIVKPYKNKFWFKKSYT
jgi:hypothetical protein